MAKKNTAPQKTSEEKVAEISSKGTIVTALFSFLGVVIVAILGYLGSRPSSVPATASPSATNVPASTQIFKVNTPLPLFTATDLPNATSTTRLTFDGYIETGKQCIETGDYECALQNFNTAIAISPDDPWGYWWRGFLYYSDKNIDASIDDFKKSASLSPGNSNASAYYYLGRIYSNEKGDYLQSIEYFNEAIRRNSAFDDAYCGRAQAYRNLNQKDNAMKDYQECLKLATESNNEFYIEFANEGLSWVANQP